MKRSLRISLISISVFFISFFSQAQDYDQSIDNLISETNLDSLLKYTRELTGEDSVLVNGSMVLIQNRVYNQNDMACEYIKQKLTEFGLNPIEQPFNSTGNNIYAIKEGSIYPDEQYIICAHYDAVANYCADDNASGCAAVIESARLLTNIDFKYTIIFAFWDEEEIGLLGSSYYATEASLNNDLIKGVINLEMFGWDGDDDMKFDIHTRDYANSIDLANLLVNIVDTYNLLLDPVIFNPGTTASDHSSFWDQGYSAICFSEGFFSGDGNPYYHSSLDRVEHFNQPYFHELSKLALSTIATLGKIHVDSIQLELTVYLEGAFLNGEMTTELNNSDLIPLSHPYFGSPWNYSGSESVLNIPENVVDWVLVDLRESDGDASTATENKSIAKQAAFLLKDGSIKDTSGINNLEFPVAPTGNLYIVIYHRNHLTIMSSSPLTNVGTTYPWDFTTEAGQAYGTAAQISLGGSIYGLYAGDADASGIIDFSDKSAVWEVQAGYSGYHMGDVNLDGQVYNQDKNNIWFKNINIESQVP